MNQIFIKIIKFYQKYLSKLLGKNCKHIPSCSNYAIEAYQKYNFFYASILTFFRIIRCNPFSKGGYDPVPERKIKEKK